MRKSLLAVVCLFVVLAPVAIAYADLVGIYAEAWCGGCSQAQATPLVVQALTVTAEAKSVEYCESFQMEVFYWDVINIGTVTPHPGTDTWSATADMEVECF